MVLRVSWYARLEEITMFSSGQTASGLGTPSIRLFRSLIETGLAEGVLGDVKHVDTWRIMV